MPSKVVKTKKDEKYWSEAKDAVEDVYGPPKKDDDRFWGTTMKIFKNKKKKHDSPYKPKSKKKKKKKSNFDTNEFWIKVALLY